MKYGVGHEMRNEDDEIYKDILLESLEHAIDEESLEVSLLPALRRLNNVPGVVTVGCCEGHPERDVFSAFVELNLSKAKWHFLQETIEDALSHPHLSRIQFHYDDSEDGIQRTARICTHLQIVKERSLEAFGHVAAHLQTLHERIGDRPNFKWVTQVLKEFRELVDR